MQTRNHADNEMTARRRTMPQAEHLTEQSLTAGADFSRLPAGRGTSGLRQQAMLQAQRLHGNNHVQRLLPDGLMEPWSSASSGAGGGPTSTSASGGSAGSAPTQISDGTATVSASGGIVTVDASMVNINAPMVRASGILQSDTLITNSVVASSYTPGAGNIW